VDCNGGEGSPRPLRAHIRIFSGSIRRPRKSIREKKSSGKITSVKKMVKKRQEGLAIRRKSRQKSGQSRRKGSETAITKETTVRDGKGYTLWISGRKNYLVRNTRGHTQDVLQNYGGLKTFNLLRREDRSKQHARPLGGSQHVRRVNTRDKGRRKGYAEGERGRIISYFGS